MSEIRDRVKEKIARQLCLQDGLDWEWLKEQQRYYGEKDCQYYLRTSDQILSIPEIAIVDREARLAFTAVRGNGSIRSADEFGYVKEVKDEEPFNPGSAEL